MAVNRGKKFEDVIRQAFEKVPDVSIDRLHDQTTGFKGSQNICDFIVYKEPYEFYIECKSVHGGTLPFSNITETQWNGLRKKSKIEGVFAGIICWFIDKDATFFIPVEALDIEKNYFHGKSIKLKDCYEDDIYIEIKGKKKQVFFEYSMQDFFDDINRSCLL